MTGSSRLDRADLLSSYPHVAPIALSMHAHERIALHRTDEAWLQRAWADPTTRVLLLDGGRLLVPDDDDQPAATKTAEQRELEARQADLDARQAEIDAERERLERNDGA